MLSNTLSIIETTIQQRLSNRTDKTALVTFFRNYKKNMWIYPGVLKRKFSLEIAEVYGLLQDLEEKGILQSCYELYCSECQKSMGIVKLFNELPESFECELCHSELSAVENSLLIYMVVRDD